MPNKHIQSSMDSSHYHMLIPNTSRKVESLFQQWTSLPEGQTGLFNELELVACELADEFNTTSLSLENDLKAVVAKLNESSYVVAGGGEGGGNSLLSASTIPSIIGGGEMMSIDEQALTVPPRSPNRIRKHSGSELLLAESENNLTSSSASASNSLEFNDSAPIPIRIDAPPLPSSPIPESLGIFNLKNNTLESSKTDSGIYLDSEMLDSSSSTAVSSKLPNFYFPYGKPELTTKKDDDEDWETKVALIFGWSPLSEGKKMLEREFVQVTLACRVPRYLNACLFQKVSVGSDTVTFPMFSLYWKSIAKYHHSEHSLSFVILKNSSNNFILPADVHIAAQDIVENHPGLEFLATLPVFQNRYMETVIARLFYSKQHNWKTQMTFQEFKKSNFLENLLSLEKNDDVNTTHEIFSYQHFYVIYCKFWELDRDHDMIINLPSLSRYEGGSMTNAILTRVMMGCGKPLVKGTKSGLFTYEDFIWFILSVEDKRTPQAIEYWFRCLDLDGDGAISLYELQHFYEDQYDRMLSSRMADVWKLGDFICSLMDLVRPKNPNFITLYDLKKCGCAHLFFDMIFDLSKYNSHINRIDPSFRELDDISRINPDGTKVKLEGFQKFAAKSYQQLAEEENQGNAYSDSSIDFDDSVKDAREMTDQEYNEWESRRSAPWTEDDEEEERNDDFDY